MRIYSSILLSSLLLLGSTSLDKPSDDRSSSSIPAASQTQIFSQGKNSNTACSRGGSREECYARFIEPLDRVTLLTDALDRPSKTQTFEDLPRGTGRIG